MLVGAASSALSVGIFAGSCLAESPSADTINVNTAEDEDDFDDEDSDIVRDPNDYKFRRGNTQGRNGKKSVHICSHANQFMTNCDEVMVFAGNAYPELAKSVAKELGVPLRSASVGRFNDGEVSVKLEESVRGKDVYIVQPTNSPVNSNLIELLLMITTAKYASAKRVTAIIPYFGYQRSSGETDHYKSREIQVHRTSNLACADVARMLETVKLDRLVTFDLQPPGQNIAEGFFTTTDVESIVSVKSDLIMEHISEHLKSGGMDDPSRGLTVVANHSYCIAMAQLVQKKLKERLQCDVELGIIMRTPVASKHETVPSPKHPNSKRSSKNAQAPLKVRHSVRVGNENIEIMGSIEGRNVLVIDDILDTGTSLERASKVLHANGAGRLYFMSNHALLNAQAPQKVRDSYFEKIMVVDTSRLPESKLGQCEKLVKLPIAPIISEVIKEMHFRPK